MRVVEKDLGAVIKAARVEKGMNQDVLAENVGVGVRHIMSIENEGGNPSYDVLYRLIRELHIPADSVFYPERTIENPQREEIIRALYDCDEYTLSIVRATVRAAVDSQIDRCKTSITK